MMEMWRRLELQEEATECGLACIAAVCRIHQHPVRLSDLRERFPVSLRGTSLERLVDISNSLGLSTRALRVEPEILADLRAPAILHWNTDHFVVLLRVGRGGRIRIFDPAIGLRWLNCVEVDASFSGVVLEVEPGSRFERRAEGGRMSWPRRVLKGEARPLFAILVLSTLLQGAVFAGPLFTQWMLDEAIGVGSKDVLGQMALGLVGLTALQVLLHFVRGWGVSALTAQLAMRWSRQVADHLLALPLAYFEKRHLGDIVSRIEGVHILRRFLTTSTVEAVIDGITAICAVCLLFAYDVMLASVAIAAVSIYWLARLALAAKMRESTEQYVRADAKQQSQMLETLRGIRSVKLNVREAQRMLDFSNALGDTVGAEVRLARLNLRASSFQVALFGVERAGLILLGALAVTEGRMTLGMLVAFLAFREIFSERACALADRVAEMHALAVHLRRVQDVLITPLEAPGTVAIDCDRFRGAIEFKDVWFRYGPDLPWILKGCSFRIDACESVVIAGASGCGKSTLLKLVLGVLQASAGQVLIDGMDVRNLRRQDYLAAVGTVMQDDSLFSGTVAYNIALEGVDTDVGDVEAAARHACVHDDIVSMTMGYSTLVGDMGDSLSGGQRQRILLARALYRQPKILLLDEATSHLDCERERSIVSRIAHMDLTRLVVAHREETIRSGRYVYTLADGVLTPGVGGTVHDNFAAPAVPA